MSCRTHRRQSPLSGPHRWARAPITPGSSAGERVLAEPVPGPSPTDIEPWRPDPETGTSLLGEDDWPGMVLDPQMLYRWEQPGTRLELQPVNQESFELETGDNACINPNQ